MANNKDKDYSSIQINTTIKEQIVEYCNRNNHKIGKFIEKIFRDFITGSMDIDE